MKNVQIKPSRNPILRFLRSLGGLLIDRLLIVDHLLSTDKIQIEEMYQSRVSDCESTNLTIFARYSNQGSLSANEWDTLRFLSKRDCKLVLVSNSKLDEIEISKLLEELHLLIIVRKNIGRDFGAFRDALKTVKPLGRYSSLLLLNNSVYWDVSKLHQFFQESSRFFKADIVGLTDSFQKSHHLQSYFLFFRGDNWKSFLNQELRHWKNWRFKRSVVEFGERGLSKRALKFDLILKSMYSYSDLIVDSADIDYLSNLIRLGVKLNPTQHLWETLHKHNFPGVKISLLDSNPANLPKIPFDPRN